MLCVPVKAFCFFSWKNVHCICSFSSHSCHFLSFCSFWGSRTLLRYTDPTHKLRSWKWGTPQKAIMRIYSVPFKSRQWLGCSLTITGYSSLHNWDQFGIVSVQPDWLMSLFTPRQELERWSVKSSDEIYGLWSLCNTPCPWSGLTLLPGSPKSRLPYLSSKGALLLGSLFNSSAPACGNLRAPNITPLPPGGWHDVIAFSCSTPRWSISPILTIYLIYESW